MVVYLNKYQPPPVLPPLTEESELFENVPPELYDLNSFLPVPSVHLGTEKIRLEPLVVSAVRLLVLGRYWSDNRRTLKA